MKMQLKVAAEDNKIIFRGEGDLQLKAKATTLSLKKVLTTFERKWPLNWKNTVKRLRSQKIPHRRSQRTSLVESLN